MGISPAIKYENSGGVGIESIMQLMLGSVNSVEDRRTFMKAVFVFWQPEAAGGDDERQRRGYAVKCGVCERAKRWSVMLGISDAENESYKIGSNFSNSDILMYDRA